MRTEDLKRFIDINVYSKEEIKKILDLDWHLSFNIYTLTVVLLNNKFSKKDIKKIIIKYIESGMDDKKLNEIIKNTDKSVKEILELIGEKVFSIDSLNYYEIKKPNSVIEYLDKNSLKSLVLKLDKNKIVNFNSKTIM